MLSLAGVFAGWEQGVADMPALAVVVASILYDPGFARMVRGVAGHFALLERRSGFGAELSG